MIFINHWVSNLGLQFFFVLIKTKLERISNLTHKIRNSANKVEIQILGQI